jgi:hypothetical protein
VEQDGEFVAAKPGNHDRVVEGLMQPCSELPQAFIPGWVAEPIVDALEVVEVDQCKGRN